MLLDENVRSSAEALSLSEVIFPSGKLDLHALYFAAAFQLFSMNALA